MYPTFSRAQFRALALVAPGRLALRTESVGHASFITTTDDAVRSGVWMIAVDNDGTVVLHMTEGRPTKTLTLAELEAKDYEERLEEQAERAAWGFHALDVDGRRL